MGRSIAILAFLALQGISVALYVASLSPLTGPDAPPLISDTMQVWSGGARADIVDSFRTGPTESAAPFRPFGTLMWASLAMLASLAAVAAGLLAFRANRPWLAAGGFAAALAASAGAVALIVDHWGGSVLYPAGAFNAGWLYMATRAFLAHVFIGYALLVIATGLVLLGVSRPDRPLGLHVVAANWAVVVITWLGAYVGLYAAPVLMHGA